MQCAMSLENIERVRFSKQYHEMTETLLEVRHLRTVLDTHNGVVPLVDDVSFSVARGKTLGLVGESGSGKTITALSILGLIRPPARIEQGEILLQGRDLRQLPSGEGRRIRGRRIAMVFQEPMSALNPLLSVGTQLCEGMREHLGHSKAQAWSRGVELLAEVGISQPASRMKDYPHELSGGMRQRVLIAIALSCEPQLIIADEPTTALDVTVQAQILELLYKLKERYQLSVIMISHDLAVIAGIADDVAVMYKGKIVEQGSVEDIFYRPGHAYTQRLLDLARKLSLLGNAPPGS